MYHFLSLLTGVVVTVMIAINGELTAHHGLYTATLIIHIVGLGVCVGLLAARREWPFAKSRAVPVAWYFYLGGAVGIFTTLSNNIAFGRISVSALLALGLLGQALASIAVDQYGLLGMPRHPFNRRKWLGLGLMLAGIVVMLELTQPDWPAVAVAFGAGGTIILARTLNAKLADTRGVRIGTFFNYVTGLAVAVPLLLLFGRQETGLAGLAQATWGGGPWWMYTGGILGASVIVLGNITVMKVSAFYLSLLLFVGHVFSGVAIDMWLGLGVLHRNVLGGVLVTAGLCGNLWLERVRG